MTSRSSVFAALVVAAAAPLVAGAQQQQQQQQHCPATTPGATMPLTYQGGPTVAAITPCDLMSRLYIYAADSMEGREAGTMGALRATAWMESEVRRLGLRPAGDNGGYFQAMPVTSRSLSGTSSVRVGGQMYRPAVDFGATGLGSDRVVTGDVVFGGTLGDPTSAPDPDVVRGQIVIVRVPAGFRGFGRGGPGAGLLAAGAIVTVSPHITRPRPQFVLNDTVQNDGRASVAAAAAAIRGATASGMAPVTVTVTPALAAAMLGKPLDQAARGDRGGRATIDLRVSTITSPTRSVVAVLPGSDPRLKNEYVVIGAHADHIGYANGVVEHDSLKAYNMVARVEGADSRNAPAPTEDQWERINAIKDSLRRIYPARLDSISNGADDDGSGSVSTLEIAEAFAKGPVKPKRSLLFIWQTGEEKGLWGSQWFTNHPTVPRDAIVADLNLDMVGRGAATDVTGTNKEGHELKGADNYLQLVGSRRLSTELGDIVEAVSARQTMPFALDYALDANGHPQNIYCRSDHANYARYGIPVVFFTTGGHSDYHQVTDEPEYIQYEHMARVDQLVYDVALRVANLDHRVVVDKAKPASPFARCQQ